MDIQWLGHSAFKLTSGSIRVLIDPFLNGNPKFSGTFDDTIAGTTHVLVTHGHNDHVGDALGILGKTGATFVSTPELCDYVQEKFPDAKLSPLNFGGTARFADLSVSMVRAHHSSSFFEAPGRIVYGGNPSGLVVRLGGHSVYHMGDTCAFSDMALIAELHKPDIVIAPIGDTYTMGAAEAALCIDRFLKPKLAIPCHYGTFPALAANADEFVRAVKSCEVWAPRPMQARTV